MPSPFPGMDSYLETPELWPDVHHAVIGHIQKALNPGLRPRYVARVELRVYISDDVICKSSIGKGLRRARQTPLLVDGRLGEAFLHFSFEGVALIRRSNALNWPRSGNAGEM
jgi:hypothetical protein